MHFKRLELFGFKSFAERTVFHYEPGVTAIVGPNGCGKTNCVDAIRWVLGEQNARDLRGETMEDVIFNGTDALPALGFAEVSLTLSNDDRVLPIDYSEVTVTRRVYRSGESEYLLNKLPVRLKDIHELFMGTGIGTESYSIIGQGKISMILSSRPEDRRAVFEEASGITKYKMKKREALRRLGETEQNLVRVNDITTEVSRQLRSIERLAEKARRYQERFDQLREAELTAAGIEHAQLTAQRATALAEARTLEEHARTLVEQWEALRAQRDEQLQHREALLQRLSDATAQRTALRGTLERHAREIQLKLQWQQDLERQCAELTAECEELRAKLQQFAVQLAATQQSLGDTLAQEAGHLSVVQQAAARVAEIDTAIRSLQQAMQTVKQMLLERTAALARTKSELAKWGATSQAHQARIRRLRGDLVELQSQADALERERAARQTHAAQLASTAAACSSALQGLQERRRQCEETVHAVTATVTELAHRRTTLTAERDLLDQLWKRHEGFSAGVKALLDAARPEVIGIVADLVDVQPGYDTALESALGELWQAVAVPDIAQAWQLIHWLRDGRVGRAHVLPLDQAASSVTPTGAPDLPGATPALQFVTVRDERVAAWVRQQLADVWFVDDLTAIRVFPASTARLIDRRGHVWTRGCLAGGEQGAQTSVVGRRARLEATQAQLAEAETSLTTKTAQLDVEKYGLAEAAAALDAHAQQVQQLTHEQSTQQMQAQQVAENLQRVTQERDVVMAELAEADREFTDVEETMARCAADASIAEQAVQALELQLNESQTALAAQSHARETQLVELASVKASRDAVTAKRQTLEAMRDDVTARREEAEALLATKQAQITAARARSEQFGQEITEHQRETERLQLEDAAHGEALADLERQAEASKQSLLAMEPRLTREQDALTAVREQQRESDKLTAALAFRDETLVTRIRDRYQCDVPPRVLTAEDAAQLATLRATIEREREKLEALGPVSLGSISEHEELTQRLTFLTTQQQDLCQAQATLKEAIQKINRETRHLFLETFERIQQEFSYFFKLLFGGGKAELLLVDPADVLECGIDINAQPPGKKLQSITLLSGGEQAMTAIALLFALFTVRPSPFCILDEIDAPLDEANVDRFTRGLAEFTKLSQFIIITHNKKTITSADVMYGITMEQAGVSKIVSVKFAESPNAAPHPASPATAAAPA